MGWLVFTPRPLNTRERDPMPMVQEAEWAQGPVRTVEENLATIGIRSPDPPALCDSLFRLRCPLKLTDSQTKPSYATVRPTFLRGGTYTVVRKLCCIVSNAKCNWILFLRMRIKYLSVEFYIFLFGVSEIRLRLALKCRRAARGPRTTFCLSLLYGVNVKWSVSCTYYV